MNTDSLYKLRLIMKLQAVINHWGSKTNVAKALGLHKSAITNWGDKVPQARQYQIEILTNGKLKAA